MKPNKKIREIDFSSIKKWMQDYNPRELFLWIQTIAVHPANMRFQIRFELLLGILFSIPLGKFKGKTLAREDVKNFIRDSGENFFHHLLLLEDYQPFDQLKLIPYFFKKKKYYFFYGALERPYEFFGLFENLYLVNNDETDCEELSLLEFLFVMCLEFQNQLLEKLNHNEKAKISSKEVYVPTQELFDEISPSFEIDLHQMDDLKIPPVIELGTIKSEGRELIELCATGNLFKTIFVHISNSNYLLIPQIHLEALFDIGNQVLKSSPNKRYLESLIFKGFKYRLWKECHQFFTPWGVVYQILQKDTYQNLAKSVDVIVKIDYNKIFLFKAAKHSFELDSSKQVKNALDELQEVIKIIKDEDIIGLRLCHNNINPVPVSEMEFWAVVVYENTTLNHRVELPEDIDMRNIWIVNMPDLQAIFEFLPTDLSLIKFLRNDAELLNGLPVSCIDYLDRFSFYINNGESYWRAGKYPDFISFAPHSWHYFFHEKTYEKYQDNIYELIECEVPNTFNYVGKQHENVYEIIDKGHLNGGIAVKYDEHLIWILYPNGLESTKEEAMICSTFLGTLYADYLVKLKEPLLELFKRYNFNFETSYRIALYPASFIERFQQLHFLKPYTSQLSKENPLIVITGIDERWRSICSCIIYDNQYLFDLFAPRENTGEKYCITQLIKSIVRFFDENLPKEEIDRITRKIVETNIPLRIKGYSLQSTPTLNPRLMEYGKHQEMSISDIVKIKREIGEFLLQNGVGPGEYYDDEAKRLNNLIFQFLQEKLEDEIRKYNESLLYYAYKEAELIEGQRENNRTQCALDASKYTEYDIVQKNMKTTKDISKVSIAAKYIIETILRMGIVGQKTINIEHWSYLQAVSVALQETAFISDCIHYDIIPYTLRVSDLYEIEDIEGQGIYNHEEFYRTEREREIDQVAQTLVRQKEELDGKQSKGEVKKFPDMLQEIDETFKSQFGFYFSNFITILSALGLMDSFDEHRFPLSLISENELMDKLRENICHPTDETEVKKILEFASLDFTTYKPDDKLLPTQLFRRKERLNLCPIIQLPSNVYLYGNQMCLGAMSLWFDSIWNGNLPCNLENNAIEIALRNLRQKLDRELEKEAERIAENILGRENIEARIDKFQRLSSLLPSRPDCGEIDVLAVNKSQKIVYILDAKNRNPKTRLSDIRREIEDFFDGERSYLAQLTRKERFVQENLDEILKHFSVNDIKGWHVRKAFVVKENYPSAYCPDKNVDFVLIDNLSEYLTQIDEEDNGNKHWKAQLYTNEGISFMQRENYQEALASFEKARNIFMKLELKEMIWQILKYELKCYIEMDNRCDCIRNISEMFKSSYKEELVEKTIENLIQFVSVLIKDFEWESLSRIVEISSSIEDFDLQCFVEALSEYGKVKLGRASLKDFEAKTSKVKNEDLLNSLDWLVILDPSWDITL